MATFGDLNEQLYALVDRIYGIPHLRDDLPEGYRDALDAISFQCEDIHVTFDYVLTYEEED